LQEDGGARPEYDTETLLTMLVEKRGTPGANLVLLLLERPLEDGASWSFIEPVLRRVQAMSHAGLFSPDERFYILACLIDAAMPSRRRLDPPFGSVDATMEAFLDSGGMSLEDDDPIADSADEEERLEEEWKGVERREKSEWLLLLGEPEMARLALDDEEAYDARYLAGLRSLQGEARRVKRGAGSSRRHRGV